jgi:hypothetical protein
VPVSAREPAEVRIRAEVGVALAGLAASTSLGPHLFGSTEHQSQAGEAAPVQFVPDFGQKCTARPSQLPNPDRNVPQRSPSRGTQRHVICS